MTTKKINRGEVLSQLLLQMQISKKTLADAVNVDRTTIIRWLKSPNLEYEKVKLICEAIDVDFLNYFPEFTNQPLQKMDVSNLSYREKYFQLLQKNQELSEKYIDLLARLDRVKNESK